MTHNNNDNKRTDSDRLAEAEAEKTKQWLERRKMRRSVEVDLKARHAHRIRWAQSIGRVLETLDSVPAMARVNALLEQLPVNWRGVGAAHVMWNFGLSACLDDTDRYTDPPTEEEEAFQSHTGWSLEKTSTAWAHLISGPPSALWDPKPWDGCLSAGRRDRFGRLSSFAESVRVRISLDSPEQLYKDCTSFAEAFERIVQEVLSEHRLREERTSEPLDPATWIGQQDKPSFEKLTPKSRSKLVELLALPSRDWPRVVSAQPGAYLTTGLIKETVARLVSTCALPMSHICSSEWSIEDESERASDFAGSRQWVLTLQTIWGDIKFKPREIVNNTLRLTAVVRAREPSDSGEEDSYYSQCVRLDPERSANKALAETFHEAIDALDLSSMFGKYYRVRSEMEA